MTRTSNDRRFLARPVLVLLALSISAGFYGYSLRKPAGPDHGTQLASSIVPSHDAVPTLRIATFNIHAGKGLDERTDLNRIAAMLGGYDIVVLNEVLGDSWNTPNQARQLGNLLEMPWLFAPTERRYGRDYFGNGLLCNLLVRSWHRIPLVTTRDKGFRNMILAVVKYQGVDIRLLGVHLDSHDDRLDHLEACLTFFDTLAVPAILLGDFNTRAADLQSLSWPSGQDTHLITSELKRPDGRLPLDHIFIKGLEVIDCQLIPTDASDHPLITAELKLLDDLTGINDSDN